MEKLKSEIITTALSLFKRYGLRSVSIDDVCKELRISKKTFYNFFKQKEELIIEVLKCMHEEAKRKTKQPWEYDKDKNIIDIIMESDKELKNSADNDKKHFTMFYDLEKYYPLIFQKQIEVMQKQNQEVMTAFINKGISENVFRNDLNIDFMSQYLSAQFKTMMNIFKTQKKSTKHQIFVFFRDIIIRVLANEKGLDYYLTKYYLNDTERET